MKRTKLFTRFAVLALAFLAAVSLSAQTPKQQQLLNGLKVMLWQDKNASDVTVRIRVHAGSAFDPQGKEGVMQLLADNLFPNESIREYFREDLGGSLDITTTYDYIQITASCKPDQYLGMLQTLASALSTPNIDKETTAKIRSALAEKVKALENDPGYVADRAVAKRLLGTFPYGRPQLGSSDSLQKITYADLIDAKQRFLTADNASITVSGNFDRTLGFKPMTRYFGLWLQSDRRVPSTFRQPDEVPAGILSVPSPQPGVAAIRAATRGTARNSKDLAASEVYGRVLEMRLRARVPAEHAKDVFVRTESHFQPGLIVVGFAASKDDVGSGNGKIEASDLIYKALNDPITDAEFEEGRSTVAAAWRRKAVEEFWLDADTFRIASVDVDRSAADKVTIADVRAFAGRARQQPMAIVLVNTPAK